MHRNALLPSPRLAVAVAVTVAGLAGAGFAAEGEAFTPFHVARIRAVTEIAVAPDGRQIAYVLSVPRRPGKDDDGPAWTELHVVDRAGRSRPFVSGQVNVAAIAWTPDGQGIAFLAKRGKDEHRALYVIPSDGGEARKILEHDTDIGAFSLSPDGARVALLAEEKAPKELEEARKKGFSQQIYEEDWRPTRVWIAAMDEDESTKPEALEVVGSASEVAWSPAGGQLAVMIAPTPLVDDSFTSRRVHVLDVDTGAIVARFDTPGKLGPMAWSPDGAHVAIVSAADENDPAPSRLLVGAVMDASLRDLVPDYMGHFADVAWRDAETVAFLGDEGTGTAIKQVALDGGEPEVLIPAGEVVVTAIRATPDGQAGALIGETPTHPAEVYVPERLGVAPRRLTDSNPWLADLRFAPQEVVTYNARDGLELEGVLIRPLDAEDSARSPLILAVHGGPESHIRNGWLTSYANPGQVAAAKGFAVFYPNYRGSTGRGVAFSKLGQADAAGKEFDDLADAVDHFVENGLADPRKVGITGGSYGGYASAWGATYYSEKFAASVMFVGISDKVSKSGTTDIPNEEYLVHARHRPWEDWHFFLERSPIRHVEKSRTPILIVHGKDDPRVHPSQSLELYRYLKLLDQAPVRLVLYPGEGHGNRRAASRLDYNLRMIQWFEHYLTGPGGEPPPYEVKYGPVESEPTTEPNESESQR